MKTYEDDCQEYNLLMYNLGACLANAAALKRAFDLGCRVEDNWYPGCGVSVFNALRLSCEWCGEIYEGDPKNKQGYRCASSVFKRGDRWYLTGHYGSCVADMELYEFNDDWCETLNSWGGGNGCDPVCDKCIIKMINCYDLWMVREIGAYGEAFPHA